MGPASPTLRVRMPRTRAQAVAVVLHGGQARSTRPTRASNGAVVRMIPFAESLRRAGRGSGLVVARVRYLVRGWNAAERSPVVDVRWALAQLEDRFAGLPVALVGHSMGGRVAFAVADAPAVRAVVALAPWIEPEDSADHLTDRRVLIAHGVNDHVTDPARSAAFAERARAGGAHVSYVSVRGTGHAMLRRARFWHELTTQFVLSALSPTARSAGNDPAVARIVEQALAGEQSLVV